MKFVFIILVSFLFSIELMAQDTIRVFINNKTVAEAAVSSEQSGTELLIKNIEQKKTTSFMIQVTGDLTSSEVYKHSLEISGDNSVIIEEMKNKPGFFDLSVIKNKGQLTVGKLIPLYLLLNPANPLMATPSRRVFLGNLVMK